MLAKQFDREFEECHVEVLNFIAPEDTTALESEEAVFDEHAGIVSRSSWNALNNLILVGTTEPVMPNVSDKGVGRTEVRTIFEAEYLSRRLSQVYDSLTTIMRIVLEEKETDMCS